MSSKQTSAPPADYLQKTEAPRAAGTSPYVAGTSPYYIALLDAPQLITPDRTVQEPGRANCLFWNGPQKTKIGGEATGKPLPP